MPAPARGTQPGGGAGSGGAVPGGLLPLDGQRAGQRGPAARQPAADGAGAADELSGGDVFFDATAPTEIYTLSLHDALPIWSGGGGGRGQQHAGDDGIDSDPASG